MNAHEMGVKAVRDAVASGGVSAEEVARACLSRIDALDGRLRAFLEVFHDGAVARARDVDRRLAAGEAVGPLAGVPVALKDNMCFDHGRTTCASRFLERYESPYSATVARRLLDAGCVVIGKTNMDEFGMGSSTEHSAFGPTMNPWDETRSPGGSSGGSAACVAARMVPASLGSDTGGSIRQPAALCGIVGMKPTYGRVSRYGLVAFASSLDQIGPFARSVEDTALLLSALCGFDEFDSTSSALPAPDFAHALDVPVQGLRIGVAKQSGRGENHPSVDASMDEAVGVFRDAGAEVVEVDLPNLKYGIAAYYLVAPAEASSNLARFDGVRYGRRAELAPGDDLEALYAKSRGEGFGREVQRRIMLGTYALSSGYYDAYYNTALKARRVIKDDFDRAFSAQGGGVHAVLMPSTAEPAFQLGAKVADPLAMYLQDTYTVAANLAGLPAVSLPAGFAEIDGVRLPVGIQLYGKAFDESTLLRVARVYERATNHAGAAPTMATL